MFVLPILTVETSGWLNSETSAFRVNLFKLLSSTVGRLEEYISETFRVKPFDWLQLVLFIWGYLATQMNSRNVESESYSDYFNPMPNVSNDTFQKKLQPDNRKEITGVMMQ